MTQVNLQKGEIGVAFPAVANEGIRTKRLPTFLSICKASTPAMAYLGLEALQPKARLDSLQARKNDSCLGYLQGVGECGGTSQAYSATNQILIQALPRE